jgi:hypothetical protein
MRSIDSLAERSPEKELTLKGVLLRSAPRESTRMPSELTGARSQQIRPWLNKPDFGRNTCLEN